MSSGASGAEKETASGHPEQELLRELTARDGEGPAEAARSLAAGAVLRGRLSPAVAAMLSSFTEPELRAITTVAGRGIGESDGDAITLSVVVPALDEEANLESLWGRLRPVLDQVGSAELVVVDDGSADGTWSMILALADDDRRVRGVRLSRNFGHQAALAAGMAAARGQAVCLMDGDLQDPPELISDLLEQWRAGNAVVYAVRRSRREGVSKRFAYRTFYRLYRRIADIDVPLDSGDFALMDRRVVDELLALPEHNRFLRGLRSWVGFRQVGVPYDRDARGAGKAKYDTRRLVRLAIDGLVSFSATPLRLASLVGILVAAAGGVYIAIAVFARLFLGGVPDGWTSIIAVLLVVGGVQLIVMGVLGEYVARIYDETKSRPTFVVAETTDADPLRPRS